MSVLRAALLELANALDAGAEALTQTAADKLDPVDRWILQAKASGYTEAASDIRGILDDHRDGEDQ